MALTILGDPHLGKKFVRGVPLERRGEREHLQWLEFYGSLKSTDGLHVCMGDLFDKSVVPYGVVLQAAASYRAAAKKKPDSKFVIIRGNHDASRDAEFVSAYQVFEALLADVPNVYILTDDVKEIDGHLFVPWHPFKTAAEMIPFDGSYYAAFGHWDVVDFGDNNPNLIPVEQLRRICTQAYTGHDHNKREMDFDGFKVHVTGSMQPYGHDQDEEGKLYVTVTVAELETMDVHDKCVRVLLQKGEELPPDIDCLQLSIKRVSEEDDTNQTVELGAFDLSKLFREAFSEEGVSDDLTKELWDRFAAAQSS